MRDEFHDSDQLGFFVGDIRDAIRLERAMTRCDVVVHGAALKRIEVGHYNPEEMVKTNVLGAMNVIDAARRAHVPRVVFTSTDKAFEPVSPYGLSKALAEHLFLTANTLQYGPCFVVLRYGNVAGSTGSVIPTWREKIRRMERISITDPEATRFWMRLDQAVDLVVSAYTDAVADGFSLMIPELPAYRLADLATAMHASHVQYTQLPAWEKKHESMSPGNSSDKARRMTVEELREELKDV